MIVALYITISFVILTLASGYDFSLNACSATTRQQSPINVILANTEYYDEKYFRFLSNNYNPLTVDNKWTYFADEKAVGIAPLQNQTNLGSFIFVKDWAMYSFNLQKILFRVNSEHQFEGKNFDAEMQLVHTIEPNYYSPGRRMNLGLDYLVISIFFKKISDLQNPARTKLFDFMNLEGFANGTSPNMSRNIKLHYIIQHQPSILYEGTLTYPECQPALWLLFSQYHWISNTDLQRLTKVIQAKTPSIVDGTTKYNTRTIFSTTPNLNLYRNWSDKEKLNPKPTLLAYSSSSFLSLSTLMTLGLIFMTCLILF